MKKNRWKIWILSGLYAAFWSHITTNADPITPTEVVDYLETEDPVMYGIGSVSKVYTAASVMRLVDEGKIDLDLPIINYIEEFKMSDERYTKITPRMLLNHSSGIMGTTNHNAALLGDPDTIAHDQLLLDLQSQRLKADPGAFSVYCNDGFTLAEILVERVSGMSFTDYMEENFFKSLGLNDTKTPVSHFDTRKIAKNYFNKTMELPKENLNLIGSGGIYSTAREICKFSQIFMKNSQALISEKSRKAMEQNEVTGQMTVGEEDNSINYGLGWDSVDTYPFHQYGIKALSKGGTTFFFNTSLTVLPEYNMAAAVIASGGGEGEALIVQEILLEVLREEGLLDETGYEKTYHITEESEIPEEIKTFAGMYNGSSMFKVEFTDTLLLLSSIGTSNDKTQEYSYTKDGYFISNNGDYLGASVLSTTEGGSTGSTKVSFKAEKNGVSYLMSSTYETKAGLGQTAISAPFAQKIEQKELKEEILLAWKEREEKTYYLMNEKYTSAAYLDSPIARIAMHGDAKGYINEGIYKGKGVFIKSAQILDQNNALAFQQLPIMGGRDLNDLHFEIIDGYEQFNVRGYQYIEEDNLEMIPSTIETIQIEDQGYAKWFKIDESLGGQQLRIEVPRNGSFFLYDSKMNCIGTSLTINIRKRQILPKDGYIVFVGEPNAEFTLKRP